MDLVPLCSVDVAFIAAEYMKPTPAVYLTAVDAGKMLGDNMLATDGFEPEDDLKTILEKERAFDAQMSRVTRVQEDALETVYSGEDKVSKPVKISTLLETEFRQHLVELLKEL